jgi:tetratricopeptide (TPR) repeat protein
VQVLALQPEREALEALEAACQARLLIEKAEGYQFPHDLIREVILADVSAARRRLLHRLVAMALEQQPGASPLEQLAYHWASAGEREKAAVALEQAGDHSQVMHAFAEAEGYYRDCLAHLEAPGRLQVRARLYEKFGNALTIQDRYEASLAVFAQAVEGYRAGGDREGQWRTLAQIGWMHGQNGTFQKAISQLEPVIERLEPGLVSSGLAALYTSMAFLAFGSSQYSKQLAFAQHAVNLAQMVKNNTVLIQAHHTVSVAHTMLGQIQESLLPLLETIRLAEQVGDLWKLSEALNGLSLWYERHGDLDQGKVYVERAYQAAEQLGWSSLMAFMWLIVGIGPLTEASGPRPRRTSSEPPHWGARVGASGAWAIPPSDVGSSLWSRGSRRRRPGILRQQRRMRNALTICGCCTGSNERRQKRIC